MQGQTCANPLSDQGLTNLIAFTRLLGYVRHFHPSDQAANADWNNLAVEGISRIEPCDGREALAVELKAFFSSIAPSLQVSPVGVKYELPVLRRTTNRDAGLKVVYWRHVGAGHVAENANEGPYKSERVYVPASNAEADGGDPHANWTYEVDLGGGLSAHIPLKLYADAAGTLPHATAPAMEGRISNRSANDRAVRLAAVALAWNVFQHFYPYFDVIETDWPRELELALATAATDENERAFLDTLRRLVSGLRDGHGGVMHPALVDNSHTLPLTWALVERKLAITHVLAGAATSDIAAGDVVLEVDGQKTEAVLSRLQHLHRAATPQHEKSILPLLLRLGPANSPVRLMVQAPSGAKREIELRRDVARQACFEPRPAPVTELEPGVHYFDISRATVGDLRSSLPQLAQAKTVIFDLRGYPRLHDYLHHLSSGPLQSAIWQIPIVTTPDRLGVRDYDTNGRWELPPQLPRLTGNTIFVSDGRAVSYAESVMGIVEAYELGDIVGETTAGTNGNIHLLAVPGGFTLIWTGMRVLKHDGSQHHGVGIRPTHPVTRTLKGIAQCRDEFLEKALEIARRSRT